MNTPQLYVTLLLVSFVFGTFLQWFPPAPYIFSALLLVLAVGLWGVTHKAKYVCFFAVIVLGLGVGGYRYTQVEQNFAQVKVETQRVAQNTNHFSGTIISDRDEREKDLQVDVRLDLPHHPVVRVTVPRQSSLMYADRVEIDGELKFPKIQKISAQKNGEEEVGTPFDYPAHLRAQRIVGEVRFAKVEKVGCVHAPQKVLEQKGVGARERSEVGKDFLRENLSEGACKTLIEQFFVSLFSFKNSFRDAVQKNVGEPYASLALGLLVGEKHGLSKVEIEKFTVTGLSHIVVLSGFNITIIVLLVFRLFAFLPREWNFVAGSLLAILFVAMTGFSSTAVRALCMAGIVVVGQFFYRASVPLMSLLVVCSAMIFYNPFILRDDVSFQLSALATLGIILYGTRMCEWFSARIGKGAGDVLGITFAASVFTLPLVAYTFGTLSLISPLANLFVLPLVQPAMAFGALTGFIGMLANWLPLAGVFFSYIAFACGILAQSLLALIFFFVDSLSVVPYASVSLMFPLWLMVGCFVFAGVCAYAHVHPRE